jgi:hypothetical protein
MNPLRCAPYLFAVLATVSQAQTNLVPPPLTDRQMEEMRKEALNKTVEKGATELPGAILTGGATLNSALGLTNSVGVMQGANLAGEVVGKTIGGVKIIVGTVKDGSDGFLREGTQFVIDQTADSAIKFGINRLLTAPAVAAGASSMTAFGVAGLSYTGGSVIGTYVRESPDIGQWLGFKRTIGDAVDDKWFAVSPDWVKEASTGTKQIDFDSKEFQDKMQADIERQRRQMSFARVSAENAEQQRQLDAFNAANPPLVGSMESGFHVQEPAPSETQIMLDSLNQSMQQYAQQRNQQINQQRLSKAAEGSQNACTPAKTLDPKTGCHSGHDEKSHPGGCKCG